MTIALVTVCALAALASADCPKYECASLAMSSYMPLNQCSFYNVTADTYYLIGCPKGQLCENHRTSNSTCVPEPQSNPGPAPHSAYPGEFCRTSYDCIANVRCNMKTLTCEGLM
jgi:hypothetical protein